MDLHVVWKRRRASVRVVLEGAVELHLFFGEEARVESGDDDRSILGHLVKARANEDDLLPPVAKAAASVFTFCTTLASKSLRCAERNVL